MKKTLEKLINLSTKIVILTDGRSITQRLKINSLGLHISDKQEGEFTLEIEYIKATY